LGSYIDLDVPDDVIGIQALRRIHAEGPKRHQLGLVLEGETPDPLSFHWEDITVDGQKVGDMTNCVWSPRMNKNIGYALISRSCSVGDTVILCRSGGRKVQARLVDMPFL
jgi:aminomethyltransferase